ncbi:hypothetical protein ADK52_14590 [Streptomyces sp. WM6372]|uniref:DUF5954 family protein n=1 Tax=Streptomyces sp. WM6372 TaxID=1415555 RepID=UPI0006AEF607|nr:DUF5954 family protein [Streptomyces sp. WM6372]KOU24160.1 hypothetical protein ADK52_14590 [Streptomyces sp. WM6372]
MDRGDVGRPARSRPMVVRVPVEPVEAAAEADAVEANARAGDVVVRGPVFGVAVQGAGDGPRWRVVSAVTGGCPQQARDSMNSLLWFRAKDDAHDRAERRALLAAVARLDVERVDEVAVAGIRYRIVRAEEYAVTGPDGIEGPRPSDPEPPVPDWSRGSAGPDVDDDLVLDPDAPVTPAQAVEQLALRGLSYSGGRFPEDVRSDAQRALDSHPDVLLLPPSFMIVERSAGGWTPVNGPHTSAHSARKALDFSLTWMWPRMRGLIAYDADMHSDARTVTAAGAGSTGPAAAELAEYAAAADRLRAGCRVNRVEFQGSMYEIARTRRLVRWGVDGPEGPRPSDVNTQDPTRLHPPLDEDGRVLPER